MLIFGAGALGSSIIDHLAKAGLGRISVVDADSISSANIGRHLLGAESIGQKKAVAVAQRVNSGYPATVVVPYNMTADDWLKNNSLVGIDVVLDLTGEPDVRVQVEQARQAHSCPLLVGWMEPYVAAAHACILPAGYLWFYKRRDILNELEAVDWPEEVIRREPGCSSRFQSYTAAAAAHAVALIADNALDIIDSASEFNSPLIKSWVRGQRYLDKHWPGLKLKDWALIASPYDGVVLNRPFYE
ncbi:ThiF family adenylyltransferase [Nitrincola sp. MINF-07-Sa-05]|uniref:ThiF family adenylyltransferase n=1 Tax=Nitrincola salilacus TaxID=3400273 RepID=UPI003917CB0E